MALKDTIKQVYHLLETLLKDLAKAEKGNRAASQRVRTGTIKLEKVAKRYRKESITAEKKGAFKKVPTKKVVKKVKKKLSKVKKPIRKAKRRR